MHEAERKPPTQTSRGHSINTIITALAYQLVIVLLLVYVRRVCAFVKRTRQQQNTPYLRPELPILRMRAGLRRLREQNPFIVGVRVIEGSLLLV